MSYCHTYKSFMIHFKIIWIQWYKQWGFYCFLTNTRRHTAWAIFFGKKTFIGIKWRVLKTAKRELLSFFKLFKIDIYNTFKLIFLPWKSGQSSYFRRTCIDDDSSILKKGREISRSEDLINIKSNIMRT